MIEKRDSRSMPIVPDHGKCAGNELVTDSVAGADEEICVCYGHAYPRDYRIGSAPGGTVNILEDDVMAFFAKQRLGDKQIRDCLLLYGSPISLEGEALRRPYSRWRVASPSQAWLVLSAVGRV